MALVVTASATSYRFSEPAPLIFVATGAAGAVSWETSGGVLSGASGTSVSLSPDNLTQSVTVTADDGATTVETAVEVYATFPFQADWRFEAEVDERDEVSEAEDGSEKVREIGDAFGLWRMGFNDREPDEQKAVWDFRTHHRKSRRFYFEDKALEVLLFGRFDSALKFSPLGPNGRSYSFVFKAISWGAE